MLALVGFYAAWVIGTINGISTNDVWGITPEYAWALYSSAVVGALGTENDGGKIS